MKLKIRNWKFGIVGFLCVSAFTTHAIDFIQTNEFIVTQDAPLSNETWISARSILIGGAVSNDLFASASEMELHGHFRGDVWGMGDTIAAGGNFRQNTRLLASKVIQLQGKHDGSVMAVASTVKLDRSAALRNDLFCMGEHVIIEGNIDGDVKVIPFPTVKTTQATLSGEFKGNVFLSAQEIVVLPETIIHGDLTYQSPDELFLPSSVKLNGTLKRIPQLTSSSWFKKNLPLHFLFGLAALVTGLVFFGLFPRYAGVAALSLKASPGLCALIGFAALVMMPLAAFLMLFTIIGFPLSILILLFYGILLYLSKIIVGLWIGVQLLRRNEFDKRRAGGPLALGLLIVYLLTIFTAVSYFINLVIIILGLGALVQALFKKPTPIILSSTTKQGD